MKKVEEMSIEEIVGFKLAHSDDPNDRYSDNEESMKFRRAFARVSNAIEGYVLSDRDRAFMDKIDMTMSKAAFKKALLAHHNIIER